MYYILVIPYFHIGTFYAPKTHKMVCPCTDKTLTFDTVHDAMKHLESQLGPLQQLSAQKFCSSGRYVLAHGEYDRPDYWVRKIRRGAV